MKPYLNKLKQTCLINTRAMKQSWVLFLVLFLFMGCGTKTYLSTSTAEPRVYLINASGYLEVAYVHPDDLINMNDTKQIADYIIMILSNGFEGSSLKNTIPDDIDIGYIVVDSGNVKINFGKSYYTMAAVDEINMRSSIIRSLTSFDQIYSVEFFVDGIPLRLNDEIIGRTYADDVMLSYDEVNLQDTKTSIILYYPNATYTKLIPTRVEVDLPTDKKIEEIVIAKYLESEDINLFSKGTELLNVYTHEGICFVDFSDAFLTSSLPTGISERIAIYSIVNSLTDLSDITEVQILVEGEIPKTFQGTLSLNRMFSKNYSLIEYQN